MGPRGEKLPGGGRGRGWERGPRGREGEAVFSGGRRDGKTPRGGVWGQREGCQDTDATLPAVGGQLQGLERGQGTEQGVLRELEGRLQVAIKAAPP